MNILCEQQRFVSGIAINVAGFLCISVRQWRRCIKKKIKTVK